MKKRALMSIVAVAALAITTMSFMPKNDPNITYENKTAVVDTKTIGSKIRGYKGSTPVKIYIRKGKIQKVEAQKNRETPAYFADAKAVLEKFVGVDIKKVPTMKVDAVSGATFSSNALVENVKAGVEYYKKNK